MAPYLLDMRVIRRIMESVKPAVRAESGLISYDAKFKPIKHQRDKQIKIAYLADILSVNSKSER